MRDCLWASSTRCGELCLWSCSFVGNVCQCVDAHTHRELVFYFGIMPTSQQKTVFATVGTTQFGALADALLSDAVLAQLVQMGYTRLVLQLGRGPEPNMPASPPLSIEWYRFKPSLQEDMRNAALIVSHAGAGSILESLKCDALLVVVVNDALMDNHQQELAEELHSRRHLLSTTPSGLAETLTQLSARAKSSFLPYPPADALAFPEYLSAVLGLDAEDSGKED